LSVAFPAGPVPVVVHPAGSLGLLPGDDLDALDVGPIPEPATFGLFIVGIAALAAMGRNTRN
jgi:hypothetical protein